MADVKMRYIQVDAFSSKAFGGNPAAVFILNKPLTPNQMQKVANELNLSETAFAVKREDARTESTYDLRWFTPRAEVDLCGHATLATAHALYAEGYQDHRSKLLFTTKSGVLEVEKRLDHIVMSFPTQPILPLDQLPGTISALQQDCEWFGRNDLMLFLHLKSAEAVRNFKVDISKINALGVGLVISAAAPEGDQVDVVSRCFFPHLGIHEDPATGAAHCGLGPYWFERLNTDKLVCEQASARRGILHLARLDGGKIQLSGQAVTTLKGVLLNLPQD